MNIFGVSCLDEGVVFFNSAFCNPDTVQHIGDFTVVPFILVAGRWNGARWLKCSGLNPLSVWSLLSSPITIVTVAAETGMCHFFEFGAGVLESFDFLPSVKSTICNQSEKQERGRPTLHLGIEMQCVWVSCLDNSSHVGPEIKIFSEQTAVTLLCCFY